MMQRNPERLVMSLRCPYTLLAGVSYPAPGGPEYETKPLDTAPAVRKECHFHEARRHFVISLLQPDHELPLSLRP